MLIIRLLGAQAVLDGAEQLAKVGKTASEIDIGGGQNAVSAMLGTGLLGQPDPAGGA